MRKVFKELKDAVKEERAGDLRNTSGVGWIYATLERHGSLAATTQHSTAGRFGTFRKGERLSGWARSSVDAAVQTSLDFSDRKYN